jgi:hypothetical protein
VGATGSPEAHPASRANVAVTNANANRLDRLPKTFPWQAAIVRMLPSSPSREGGVDPAKGPFATTERELTSDRLYRDNGATRKQRQLIFFGARRQRKANCYQRPLLAGGLRQPFGQVLKQLWRLKCLEPRGRFAPAWDGKPWARKPSSVPDVRVCGR